MLSTQLSRPVLGTVLLAAGLLTQAHAAIYTCGDTKAADAEHLSATTRFANAHAGFDLTPSPGIARGACTADRSFFFSAPLPEGNYLITVDLGGPVAASTTVKAEARRLMLLNVRTAAGSHRMLRFAVNIRTTALPGGGSVRIKPREIGSLRWDDKLTLEFAGTHPSVRSITIVPAPKIPTIYLAGDSTVVDQDKEPWAAWGQVLPSFFDDRIAIANHAESGETIASSQSELRFERYSARCTQEITCSCSSLTTIRSLARGTCPPRRLTANSRVNTLPWPASGEPSPFWSPA